MVTELEEEVGVRRHTYLFDSWFSHDLGLVKHVESDGKDWIGPLRSNRKVTYENQEMRVDALEERIDKEEREIEEETSKIWAKTLPVSKLGEVRLVIAEKVTHDDEENGQVPCDKQDRRGFSPYHSELFRQMANRDVLRGLEAGFGPGRLRGA